MPGGKYAAKNGNTQNGYTESEKRHAVIFYSARPARHIFLRFAALPTNPPADAAADLHKTAIVPAIEKPNPIYAHLTKIRFAKHIHFKFKKKLKIPLFLNSDLGFLHKKIPPPPPINSLIFI